jgi:uncharacterized protein YndB with AHSA1/START domain
MISPMESKIDEGRSFTIRRDFHAPIAAVFQLWTDAELVRQWWGIENCTIPTCILDVRAGGEWRIDMLTMSGKLYRNHGVYRRVVANRYLEYTDEPDPELAEWAGSPPGQSVHAATFEGDEGDVTHVIFKVTLAAATDRTRLLAMGMREGWTQSFDRLVMLISATRTQVGR